MLTSLLSWNTWFFLCDDTDCCHVLDFASKKPHRVACSIIEEELYTFKDAFDTSHTLLIYVMNALVGRVVLHMLTESKQVFDILTRGKCPTDA